MCISLNYLRELCVLDLVEVSGEELERLEHRNKSNCAGNCTGGARNMLRRSVLRRFLRVERIVDTVGVCGSNPHAPTNLFNKLAHTTLILRCSKTLQLIR